jgi:hypothetical protein
MLNNYVGIFCLALCAYLFVDQLLHLFAPFSCSIAPVYICASHSVTASLEVLAHGPGCGEFYFGQGTVLLKGHPSSQPLLRGVQSSQPA